MQLNPEESQAAIELIDMYVTAIRGNADITKGFCQGSLFIDRLELLKKHLLDYTYWSETDACDTFTRQGIPCWMKQ